MLEVVYDPSSKANPLFSDVYQIPDARLEPLRDKNENARCTQSHSSRTELSDYLAAISRVDLNGSERTYPLSTLYPY